MKTKEELNAIKEEVETLNEKLQELTEEELAQITGGKRAEAEFAEFKNYVAVEELEEGIVETK